MNKLILILVTLINYWIWRILQTNIALAFLEVITVFVLSNYFKSSQSGKIGHLLVYLLLAVTVFLTLPSSFDRTIFTSQLSDKTQLNKRHGIYAVQLKELYTNKWSSYYYQHLNFPLFYLQKNFFFNLDPNLYFFSGHPRETASRQEFEKFFWWEAPLFFIGLYYIFRKGTRLIAMYLITIFIITAFFKQSYQLGPIILFPIIVLAISLGIRRCYELLTAR